MTESDYYEIRMTMDIKFDKLKRKEVRLGFITSGCIIAMVLGVLTATVMQTYFDAEKQVSECVRTT
jgi:hypothetical protein